MIPLFHASGHNLYAKSAHLYLDDAMKIKEKFGEEGFRKFVSQSYFTIRRLKAFWGGGMWTDMI